MFCDSSIVKGKNRECESTLDHSKLRVKIRDTSFLFVCTAPFFLNRLLLPVSQFRCWPLSRAHFLCDVLQLHIFGKK